VTTGAPIFQTIANPSVRTPRRRAAASSPAAAWRSAPTRRRRPS